MRRRSHHLPNRVGHTLVELIVSLAGASVLMLGLSSTLFIALKITDPSSTPTSATLEGNDALTEFLSDIEFAISFSEQTASAVTFTVPDRNGDTLAETIRYVWSGTQGDPLTRQYNGGTASVLVENVHDFGLDYFQPDSAVEYVTVRIRVTDNSQASIETSIPVLNR
ncbi:hypothetical protein [Aporhodopirellula aestuarii]|uniref:Prepilin-type N-terminal cleavage/methylation domain-containing protein n=1 Tax=Aporhodopirellula aestuarii TaxID=2950107 RepID=A0ABT0UDD5_9BACT|nr:hypothetical protein [Aporhodopirellula aestuarii]MCM2374807.1 hypothetical protein [Aporhodopirellula aestuarii]